MWNRLLAACLACALCPAAAFAGSPAKDLGKGVADDAAAAFKDQRFEQAAELFEKAYALGNDKYVRLRNAGRAWEEAGKLEYARTQFQKFLDKVPSGPDHAEVAQRLERLEARIAAAQPAKPMTEPLPKQQVAPAPEPGPLESAEPVARTVQPQAPQPPRWVPWTLLGGGVAMLAGGLGWMVATETANSRLQSQDAAGQYSSQKLASDQAVILHNRIGWIALGGVGLGAAVVGIVELTHTAPDVTAHVQPLWLHDGAGLAWQGTF